MQRIELHNILPKVFADAPITASDVWLTEFVFEKGEHYMVKAESGTGKSSLCSYIYGYRTDYSGQITFDGADIAPLNAERWSQIRRTEIAYLPQEMRLFPELTALENVLLKNQLTNHCSEREILDMFATLGISDKVDSPVQRLSIGQQQRGDNSHSVPAVRLHCARRTGEPPRPRQQSDSGAPHREPCRTHRCRHHCHIGGQ